MMNKQQTAFDLLKEGTVWPQTLLENYLTVALGLRKCSLMTIPAELPDAESIAKAIDLACVSDYRKVALERNAGKKRKLIQGFKNKLREAYEQSLRNSSSYRSHIAWTNRLGIQIFEVEVRPTVRELFLYLDSHLRSTLQELSARRAMLREEILRSLTEPLPHSVVAYPEEYSPEYVLRVGELLRYPRCCTKAYVEGRTRGKVLAEERASKQIKTARVQGIEPDPYAYFVKDFMPCTPTCSNVATVGRTFLRGSSTSTTGFPNSMFDV